jgi:hypothetical protein
MNSILQKRFVELNDNDNGSAVILGRDTKALAMVTERDFVNKVRSSEPFSVYSCTYA